MLHSLKQDPIRKKFFTNRKQREEYLESKFRIIANI